MLSIGKQRLSLRDYQNILVNNEEISISSEVMNNVIDSFNFLNNFQKDKVIYGINTGLGPMAQYSISEGDRIELQYNAIRSHCSGQGNYIPDIYVKSAIISILNSLIQGYSGVHQEVVEILKEFINKSIIPQVPEHGGVGASGDLVQLAHIALAVIGEGNVSYNGNILPANEVFINNKLKPATIHIREGLSLINGTYVMTGIGMVNLMMARNLLDWSIIASSMITEIVCSFNDFFSSHLNEIKHHNGQNYIAGQIRTILSDSKLIRNREDHLFNKQIEDHYFKDKVQEYYSIRCVPQILGPIYDTLINAENVVTDEANSVCDNPLIDRKNNNIFHGGNFHGDYVSLEMDKIKIAVTKLSMLAERQINFLMNNKLNHILPPFVNLGKLGVNFGMQGVQFTATSTVAENQTYSFPMYVHSISCNNDNQDIVSMGTNSALLAKKVIDNSFQVIAIELLTIIQAIDYLKNIDSMSTKTRNIYKELRKIVPRFEKDTVKHIDINKIKDYILLNQALINS